MDFTKEQVMRKAADIKDLEKQIDAAEDAVHALRMQLKAACEEFYCYRVLVKGDDNYHVFADKAEASAFRDGIEKAGFKAKLKKCNEIAPSDLEYLDDKEDLEEVIAENKCLRKRRRDGSW